MENVFGTDCPGDVGDAALVCRAQQGERAALEALVSRHQGWIYNLALRMVGSPEDAEDVAQEILVKLITRLSTFRGQSSFRTWLYRIVVNHVLTMRRRPWERMFSSLDRHSELIDSLDLSASRANPENELLVHETRAGCMIGMLLCLDRPQRVAIVLSTLFGADSTLGGDLLETSAQNYRQILSRAKKQLGGFMNDTCGLMNEANPCRCEKKTKAAIKAGLVDPEKLRFNMSYLHKVKDFVIPMAGTALEMKLGGVLRDQPMYKSPDLTRVLTMVLRRGELGKFINFT